MFVYCFFGVDFRDFIIIIGNFNFLDWWIVRNDIYLFGVYLELFLYLLILFCNRNCIYWLKNCIIELLIFFCVNIEIWWRYLNLVSNLENWDRLCIFLLFFMVNILLFNKLLNNLNWISW